MKKRHLNSAQIIPLGFLGLIIVGALLLWLPISTTSGEMPEFSTALFTSTTSVCVTGSVVVDTFSYWSGFGQAVILLLIQLGGE
jgi:trk system potassium uptake protein TrkH